MSIEELKVAGATSPVSLAGAIAAILRKGGEADLVAVGAAAVNQGVKALAISRRYLTPEGVEAVMTAAFDTQLRVENREEDVVGMRMRVKRATPLYRPDRQDRWECEKPPVNVVFQVLEDEWDETTDPPTRIIKRVRVVDR